MLLVGDLTHHDASEIWRDRLELLHFQIAGHGERAGKLFDSGGLQTRSQVEIASGLTNVVN
jgi:hypothetical protein